MRKLYFTKNEINKGMNNIDIDDQGTFKVMSVAVEDNFLLITAVGPYDRYYCIIAAFNTSEYNKVKCVEDYVKTAGDALAMQWDICQINEYYINNEVKKYI